MILTFALLIVAALGFWFQDRSHRLTLNDTIGHYEAAMAWERTRCDSLIAQVQSNAQGLPHYPMTGPFEAPAPSNTKTIYDETGLIEAEFDPDSDDLFGVR